MKVRPWESSLALCIGFGLLARGDRSWIGDTFALAWAVWSVVTFYRLYQSFVYSHD